jgi:hypothetical protein
MSPDPRPLRKMLLILGLFASGGCADRYADVKTKADAQAGFMQDLSDSWFGRNSSPTFSSSGSVYAPSSP